ncbi:MAG: RidA family protein [Pseudodesulfovibrio sp.]|uniref:RidA family protein n=1 Tax=Pseudodesulfovibrio sp. TaxID=2035812 RepID=UPI003D10A160
MTIQRTNVPDLPAPLGPYVHAVRHGDTLYLSGLTAHGSDAASGPVEDQTREIFRQIGLVASAHGTGLENLLKVTAFVTEMDRVDPLRQALFDVYGEDLPASSLVRVAGLFADGLKIEVEAVLAVHG